MSVHYYRALRTLGALATALAAGCVTLPDDEAEEKVATGSVSVSTPLFTPITTAADGDKALRFGQLRDEQVLADSVERPVLGITQMLYEAWRATLKGKVTGGQVDINESLTSEASRSLSQTPESVEAVRQRALKDEYKRTATRTFKSPEVPGSVTDADHLSVPKAVEDTFFAQLQRSTRDYGLTPGERATLIAAHKLHMVNMEEYFNLEGFSFRDARANEFLPYKVHFTVSAEPGWYTRYYAHDAVAELSFGNLDPDTQEVYVVAAMPMETAQAVDQLRSSLSKVQLAFELEGTFKAAAARTQLQHVREAVERLEGLRTQSTMVVGFPDESSVRVRIRPRLVPTEEHMDAPPRVRTLTALVLVRQSADASETLNLMDVEDGPLVRQQVRRFLTPRWTKLASSLSGENAIQGVNLGGSWSAGALQQLANKSSGLDKARNAFESTLREAQQRAKSLLTQLESADEKSKAELTPKLKTARQAANSAKVSLDLLAAVDRYNTQTVRPDWDHEVAVRVNTYFVPSLREEAGDYDAPTAPGRWFNLSHPTKTLACTENDPRRAPIPVWPGPTATPFTVRNALGYYWGDFRKASAALIHVDRAQMKLDKAKAANAAATQAVKTREANQKAAAAAAKAAQAAYDKIKADPKVSDAKKKEAKANLEKATEAQTKANTALERAKLDQATAKKTEQEAREVLTSHEGNVAAGLTEAKLMGTAIVACRVTSPAGRFEAKTERTTRTAVWARVVGADSATSFQRLGSGNVDGTIEIEELNLSQALPTLTSAEYPTRPPRDIRVLLEVVLVEAQTESVTLDTNNAIVAKDAANLSTRVLGRVTQEVALEPRAKTPEIDRKR